MTEQQYEKALQALGAKNVTTESTKKQWHYSFQATNRSSSIRAYNRLYQKKHVCRR